MAEARQPTYQSLYRKWRSQTFSDVVSQKYIIKTLQNAIQQHEIAHAYLFAGPRGTGKTSIARIFAKAINCPNQKEGEPCNTCSSCERITRGSALDVIEIDGASNRGIDQIRQLREEVNFAPAECPYKIYIIDEVHMLTNEAFNALLKTLEEPPSRVIFIFATTESHKVPPTVLSRCQAFEFRQFSQDQIEKHLSMIAKEEGVSIEPAALQTIARHAHGAMRDALVLFEQIISYKGRKEIVVQDLFEILGLPSEMLLESFLQAILTGDRWRALEVIQELAERGRDFELFLRELIHQSRSRLIKEIETAQGKQSDLAEPWVWLTSQLLELKREMRYAFDRRILFEVKVLELAGSKPEKPQISQLEMAPSQKPAVSTVAPIPATKLASKTPAREVAKAPLEVASAKTSEIAKPAPANSESIHSRGSEPLSVSSDPKWSALLEKIRQENVRVHALIIEASGHLDGNRLFVEFPPEMEFQKQRLEQSENLKFLKGVVSEFYGEVEMKIRFAPKDGGLSMPTIMSPSQPIQPDKSAKKPDAKEKAELVRQIFDGEILS